MFYKYREIPKKTYILKTEEDIFNYIKTNFLPVIAYNQKGRYDLIKDFVKDLKSVDYATTLSLLNNTLKSEFVSFTSDGMILIREPME